MEGGPDEGTITWGDPQPVLSESGLYSVGRPCRVAPTIPTDGSWAEADRGSEMPEEAYAYCSQVASEMRFWP